MVETYDVVDEFDRVIGRASRQEVHERNLMHRAAHVLAFDSRGWLWLQQRSAKKDRCPLLWDSSAAGHVASGECYDVCARRETREEMGLEVVPRFVFKLPACQATDWEHVAVYTCRVNARIRYPREEIARGEFFPMAALFAWADRSAEQFSSSFRLMLREWQQRGWGGRTGG